MAFFEQRATKGGPYSPSDIGWYLKEFNVPESDSGVTMTPDLAMQISAVFRGVMLIASFGTLPLKYYRTRPDGGREEARGRPLWNLLHEMPNPEMSAAEYWQIVFGHYALRHNHYSQIIRNGAGTPVELWPLRPDRMIVERISGELLYRYTNTVGTERTFSKDQIFHVRGMMNDGLVGVSPYVNAINAMGLRRAQEKYHGKLFKNQGLFKFVWVRPTRSKTEEARRRLQSQLNDAVSGLENAGSAPLLEEGLDIKTVGMSAEDAQALAMGKFSIVEIGRFLGVPPHLLYELDRATFSNIEEQSIEWVRDSVRPTATLVEGAIKRCLVPDAEKADYYPEFTLDALLRGNTEARWTAYERGLQNGVYSINQVLRKENENPIGPEGDKHLVQLSYIDVADIGLNLPSTEPAPAVKSAGPHEERSILMRQRLRQAHSRTYLDAFQRMVKRETQDIRRALAKHLDQRDTMEFASWLAEFYREFAGTVSDAVRPAVLAYAEQIRTTVSDELGKTGLTIDEEVRRYTDSIGTHWAAGSQGQLDAIMAERSAEDVRDALEARLGEWEAKKAGKFTQREIVRSGEAFAMATAAAGGFTRKRWRTVSDTCPYCRSMDGRLVTMGDAFLNKGATLRPVGNIIAAQAEGMLIQRTIKHPPAHDGCDCITIAEV